MKNKIFTEDIFYEPEITKAVRKRDKRYRKIDWEHIEVRAIQALGVFAIGYMIIHIVIYAMGIYN